MIRGVYGLLLLAGCYAHGDSHRLREAPPQGPMSLLEPFSGAYRIVRDGQPVGMERFTITASTAVWQVRGETIFDGANQHRQGYLLAIDRRTSEPIAFEAWIEIMGVRRTARGIERAGRFEISVRGVGPPEQRSVPYAPGTTIGFGTPLFHTLAMSLLLRDLTPAQPVEIRTIALSLPMLSPVVTLQRYTLKDRVKGVARVESKIAAAKLPTGLWVREDGMPVKVRTIDHEGSVVDMILQGP